MVYQRGDIVLVPFPFTDLSATRTRPALVISVPAYETTTGDIVCSMITSVPHSTAYDYQIADWRGADLLRPSWVRAGKVVTLAPSLIRFRPGKLLATEIPQIEQRVRMALGL